MELTFCTELGESYAVEIDENMELENVMALLEVEVSSAHVHTLAFDTVDHRYVHVAIRAFCEAQLIVQSHSVLPLRSMYPLAELMRYRP
jgi:hypothetical protein